MSHDHVVEMPKAVWAIKIVQSIIAVLVLAFSAFTIAVIPNGYSGFCIFTVSLHVDSKVSTISTADCCINRPSSPESL